MAIDVDTLMPPAMTDADAAGLAALTALVYPPPAGTPRDERAAAAELAHTWRAEGEGVRRFVARREGRIVAAAMFFPRVIGTARGPMTVGALGGVMSHPEVRGLGYGRAVVRAAFDRVDAGEFPFSVFQTRDARGFYERLGCVPVENRVVNSRHPTDPGARPFWDPWAMRYPRNPASNSWPEGEIDLLGPAW